MRYCGDVMRARKEWWTAMEAEPGLETDEDSDGADGVYEGDASAACSVVAVRVWNDDAR